MVLSVASAQDSDSPWQNLSYTNAKTLRLRTHNLNHKQFVEPGAEISIDPQFLFKIFQTASPTHDQVQRLLLNPEEATKGKVVTQSFLDTITGKTKNDYFFPVIIKSKNGTQTEGKMAFQAYFRDGQIELSESARSNYQINQNPDIAERKAALIEQNRKMTEAGTCTDCSPNGASGNLSDLTQLKQAVSQAPPVTSSTNNLWEKYTEFAREFTKKYPHIKKSRAGYYKRLYVKSLIEKFGAQDAGLILAALTGFSESPSRENTDTQIAEIAAVLKVIENRTINSFRTKSKTLRDIGVSESEDKRLSVILSDWQFSAWNDKDNNLLSMLNFNPDKSDNGTKRRIALSFEAQRLMQQGSIEFIGNMNNPKLHHYHANYVNPSWSDSRRRVESKIKVNETIIDLNQQRGARHIFYAGIA